MAKIYFLDKDAPKKYKKRHIRRKKYSKYVLYFSLLTNVLLVIFIINKFL